MKSFGECHAHIFMNGMDYHAAVRAHENHPDEALIRMAFRSYKEHGVTFVRDGGDHFGVSKMAKEIAPEYGIRYLSPIFGIFHEGNYGRVVGRGYTNRQEYTALVKEAVAEGTDFIKIMTSGIMTFSRFGELTGYALPYEEVRVMVEIAHESGCKVMSHTNGAEAVLTAVRAGVDSLEHGNFQNEESCAALAESETVWVPTIVTVRNLFGCGRFDDTVLHQIYEDTGAWLRRAYAQGGTIALGSDAGAYMVHHGESIGQEAAAIREILGEDPDLDQRLTEAEARIQAFQKLR